jgi:hypothetical protein
MLTPVDNVHRCDYDSPCAHTCEHYLKELQMSAFKTEGHPLTAYRLRNTASELLQLASQLPPHSHVAISHIAEQLIDRANVLSPATAPKRVIEAPRAVAGVQS